MYNNSNSSNTLDGVIRGQRFGEVRVVVCCLVAARLNNSGNPHKTNQV